MATYYCCYYGHFAIIIAIANSITLSLPFTLPLSFRCRLAANIFAIACHCCHVASPLSHYYITNIDYVSFRHSWLIRYAIFIDGHYIDYAIFRYCRYILMSFSFSYTYITLSMPLAIISHYWYTLLSLSFLYYYYWLILLHIDIFWCCRHYADFLSLIRWYIYFLRHTLPLIAFVIDGHYYGSRCHYWAILILYNTLSPFRHADIIVAITCHIDWWYYMPLPLLRPLPAAATCRLLLSLLMLPAGWLPLRWPLAFYAFVRLMIWFSYCHTCHIDRLRIVHMLLADISWATHTQLILRFIDYWLMMLLATPLHIDTILAIGYWCWCFLSLMLLPLIRWLIAEAIGYIIAIGYCYAIADDAIAFSLIAGYAIAACRIHINITLHITPCHYMPQLLPLLLILLDIGWLLIRPQLPLAYADAALRCCQLRLITPLAVRYAIDIGQLVFFHCHWYFAAACWYTYAIGIFGILSTHFHCQIIANILPAAFFR